MVVLLADDVPDVREMYRIWMELCGFVVLEAADGLEAVELAQQRLPDVIVMDISMPRLDGWDACRRLKADPNTRRIPIVALSAHGYPDSEARSKAAGCDKFVNKPCDPAELEELLRLTVTQARQPR